MFGDPFYHSTIKKTVIAFGSLFDNIYIVRNQDNNPIKIKVPIIYSGKEKFIQRYKDSLDRQPADVVVQTLLPRIGFEMTEIQYDSSRKKPSINRRLIETDELGNSQYKLNYTEVPYNINFSLSVYVRNIDDGLQIAEQILPFFTPDFTVAIKQNVLNAEGERMNIPFVLNSVSQNSEFEGSMELSPRILIWDYSFTSKINLFGPLLDAPVIKYIEANIYDFNESDDFYTFNYFIEEESEETSDEPTEEVEEPTEEVEEPTEEVEEPTDLEELTDESTEEAQEPTDDSTETINLYAVPNEDNKRMYSFIGIGINSVTNEPWNSMTDTSIAAFKGNPLSGTRAYAWEADPVDPESSSPWHNLIYELTIDTYNWGSRAMFLYMPFGSFNYAFFLTPEIYKRTLIEETTDDDKINSPARWKGFKESIKALLDGTLNPQDKTPMNEPCNVCIYHPSNRAYLPYRQKSNSLWDSLGSTTEERDINYYEYLDAWIDDLISIKSNNATFSIILDATSNAATPSTVSLYRSLPDYRSDALEVSDWYVFSRLKSAGIDVYYESRTKQSRNQITISGLGSGTVGDSAQTLFFGESFAAEEYWLWFSNPSSDDVNFDDYQTDGETPAIIRFSGNNFPVPSSKDPFGTLTSITYNGITKILSGTSDHLYTPNWLIWNYYSLSDNYRKYYNKRTQTELFTGIQCMAENIIAFFPINYIDGVSIISVYNGVADPEETYWRLPCGVIQFRPLFNESAFIADPDNYTGGYWTAESKDYWDTNIRKSTFGEFIDELHQYSLVTAPPNTEGWTGAVYGTESDSLVANLFPRES